jgi:hypothetical protein
MGSSKSQTRTSFLSSEEAQELKRQLVKMERDEAFHTVSTYTADSETYPNNLIPFADKHIKYLSEHLNINGFQYLANLRLVTRAKTAK